jgi:hypothetical protein
MVMHADTSGDSMIGAVHWIRDANSANTYILNQSGVYFGALYDFLYMSSLSQ